MILFGKQGLALRGHHDDHALSKHEEKVGENQGNFIELVRFRALTADALREYL